MIYAEHVAKDFLFFRSAVVFKTDSQARCQFMCAAMAVLEKKHTHFIATTRSEWRRGECLVSSHHGGAKLGLNLPIRRKVEDGQEGRKWPEACS